MKEFDNGLQELTSEELEQVAGGGFWGSVLAVISVTSNAAAGNYEDPDPAAILFGLIPTNLMLGVWGGINSGLDHNPGYPM